MNRDDQRAKINRLVKAVCDRDVLLRKRKKQAKKRIELAYLKQLAKVSKTKPKGVVHRVKRKSR
jgi:hypothetical protein